MLRKSERCKYNIMQRFVYAWTPESTPRYTSFSQDEGFRSKLYSFRVSSLCSGCESIGFRKKKICICACTNMCKIIREWNVCFNKRQQWFCHFGLFFFLTQTHFDMQIFCKRINELVLFIIKALHCLMCHLTTRTRMCIHRGMQCVQCSPAQ